VVGVHKHNLKVTKSLKEILEILVVKFFKPKVTINNANVITEKFTNYVYQAIDVVTFLD